MEIDCMEKCTLNNRLVWSNRLNSPLSIHHSSPSLPFYPMRIRGLKHKLSPAAIVLVALRRFSERNAQTEWCDYGSLLCTIGRAKF